MADRVDGIDSTFRYILIAAKRASQLIEGARPRIAETKLAKPTTLALAELEADKVPWRIVTPEEYEQLRQEEILQREKGEQPPALLTTPRPLIPLLDEADADDEDELEEEFEAPDFEAEELGDVEEMPDELLETPESEA